MQVICNVFLYIYIVEIMGYFIILILRTFLLDFSRGSLAILLKFVIESSS